MARDTSLGYIVANKFSMDPDKRQKIFSQCKKEDNSLEQRKQEILEKYADKNKESTARKMILKARRVLKEKLRAKNFRKNYKQRGAIKR